MATDATDIADLDAEIEALDRVEEAMVTLLSLKAGDQLTAENLADLLFLEEYYRKDQETQTDVFHRGYQSGLRRGAGADTAKLIEERDEARTRAMIANALRTSNAHHAFIVGAQVCREMMARFIEQGGDATTANSVRQNWRPSWGDDPGAPSDERYETAAPCEINTKADADEQAQGEER